MNSISQDIENDTLEGNYIPLKITVKLDHAELRKIMGTSNKEEFTTSEIDSLIRMFYTPYTPTENEINEKPQYSIITKDNEDETIYDTLHRTDVESLEQAKNTVKNQNSKHEIIATYGDKRIIINPDIIANKNELKSVTIENKNPEFKKYIKEDNQQKGIVQYKVQIAACRVPLSPFFINMIYKGSSPVKEIYEDNWYKYRIDGGNTYVEAHRRKSACKVKRAFVVATINNERIDIKQAIELTEK